MILWSLLCVTVLVLLAVAGHMGTHFYIKNYGLSLKPSKDISAHKVTHYLQSDPAWASDKLGDSQSSMGGTGCLVSVLASVLNDLGVDTDPGRLNAALSEAQGFINGNVLWSKLHELFPAIDYKSQRIFTSGTLEKALQKDLLPIVKVKYLGGGVSHWLLVVGAAEGEFLVVDPLDKDQELMPLSRHGKIFAYRVLVPVE